MLTLYFSGTGNTKYIAELFSQKASAKCLSIEDDADFSAEIKEHGTIAVCYPIYNSRVPLIMREFTHKNKSELIGKKVIILVTQQAFSGDGARVFTDMFKDGEIDVIYAEHFNMQQNMGNIPILEYAVKPTEATKQKYIKKTERKMSAVCKNIKSGVVKKRGFSVVSKLLGYIQGKPWQKSTSEISPQRLEKKMIDGLQIHEDCTACNLCVQICPMKNLVNHKGKIQHLNNCTVCYRCVNRCPKKAITVFIHRKPNWQYTFNASITENDNLPFRKLLAVLSIFHAVVNTLYLVRFIGILPPIDVVYGYVPWFMSFALPNAVFTMLSWLLVYSLLKKSDTLAVLVGLIISGGLIFHALNGFMFAFYSGSLNELSTSNAVFEIVVYAYGLLLSTLYISQFWKFIKSTEG